MFEALLLISFDGESRSFPSISALYSPMSDLITFGLKLVLQANSSIVSYLKPSLYKFSPLI